MMDPELKAKWIEALRSGKYKQHKRALKSTDFSANTFCCLGVLCEISQKGHWDWDRYVIPKEAISSLYNLTLEGYMGNNPFGILPDDAYELTNLNDNKEYSFEDIADFLENHPNA